MARPILERDSSINKITSDLELKTHFEGKRFLFVIGQYSKLGGAERQAIILAEQLKNQYDCHVDFLAWGGEGRVVKELENRGIKAWVFPLDWNRSQLRKPLTLLRLAQFIKLEIKPDYLLPYIGFNCKIVGLIWRRTGAQYTWWNQRDEGRDIFGSWLEKRVINSVPDVVSNSFEGRDFLVNVFGLNSDRVKIINNAIENQKLDIHQDWRKKLEIPPDAIVITMVANFTKYKDHETLIRAFARLCDAKPDVQIELLLVGRLDVTAQAMKALSFDLGLCGKVHFAGEVESVADYFAATDLAVHSSTKEGCPNAVLEAMAHGLPVCGTDISGIRQALGVENDSHLLAAASDDKALCHVIRKLVENSILRTELGIQNRQRIQAHFAPEALTTHVLSLVKDHACRQ